MTQKLFSVSRLLGITLLLGHMVHAADPVPVPWNGMDIGDLKPTGSAQATKDAFTLTGGIGGLASGADQFHYVYQSMTGDFLFVARVTTKTNPGEWAKAGLMVREALATNSNFVDVATTPGHGALYQYRTLYTPRVISDMIAPTAPSPATGPVWLRLVKRGSNVNGYIASDAQGVPGAWKRLGDSQPVATGMIYVGLFLTGQAPGQEFSATFDHVTLTPGPQTLLDNGTYTIVPTSAPNLMLAAGATSGAVTQIATPDNSPGQKWVLTNKGNGLYAIQPVSNPALALAVAEAKADNGAKVVVQTDHGQSAERWRIISNDNGTYGLAPQFAPSSGLDDLGGNTKPGTPMDIWEFLPNDQHTQWMIELVG